MTMGTFHSFTLTFGFETFLRHYFKSFSLEVGLERMCSSSRPHNKHGGILGQANSNLEVSKYI